MADWVRAGQSIETFWSQTPRTFQSAVQGYADRIADQHRELAWLAWHVGLLAQMKPKNFPPLAELAGDRKPEAKVQSNDQFLAAMRKLQRKTPGMKITKLH